MSLPKESYSQFASPGCLGEMGHPVDCAQCVADGIGCGSAPAQCCCDGHWIHLEPNWCQCSPLPPCSRYTMSCDGGHMSSSCSDSCPSPQVKCLYPDATGVTNYTFSCCISTTIQPIPTPLPNEPLPTPPPTALCPGLTPSSVFGAAVCNSDFTNCSAVASSCSEDCPDIFPNETHSLYKCYNAEQALYANGDGVNRYLFTCSYLPCGGGVPPVPPPGSGVLPTPAPNLEGWPPGYPLPPAEAYPVPYVPCDEVRPNLLYPSEGEFHSLRPYQASPCDRNFRLLALYCGNDLILQADEDVSYNYLSPPSDCVDNGDGTDTCYWEFEHNDIDVAIDLSGAEYPIAGYTEPSRNNLLDPYRVVNTLNPDLANETVDDATKMNEYVSWYLNGVTGRAEYSPLGYIDRDVEFLDPTTWIEPPLLTYDSERKLLSFSGPLKKLLPLFRSSRERISEVNNAFESTDAGGDERIRHNQVVACHEDFIIDISGLIYQNLGDQPLACHNEGVSITDPTNKKRLADWYTSTDERIPPLENDYAFYENVHDAQSLGDYLLDYREWRGMFCITLDVAVPILGDRKLFLCFNNILESNVWSNLFSYVNMSSTEDMLGYVEAYTSTTLQPDHSNYTVTSAVFTPDEYGFSFLYVPHMDELDELATPLQKTFASRDFVADPNNSWRARGLLNEANSEVSEVDPYCDIRHVRTNPGDQLFAGEITGTISWSVVVEQDFYNGDGTGGEWCGELGGTCENTGGNDYCSTYYPNLDCPASENCCPDYVNNPGTSLACSSAGGICIPINYTCTTEYPSASCSNDHFKCGSSCTSSTNNPTQSYTAPVRIVLKLRTAIPKADRVWKRLVAGAQGIARRWFPKIAPNIGAPFDFFWDMPGETNVSYSSSFPTLAGNPFSLSVRSGQDARLYFPHLGGIKEYFLTGIQSMLRPKGFASTIIGNPQDVPVISTDCAIGTGYCAPEALEPYFPGHEIEASIICQAESGSDPWAQNLACLYVDDGIDNDELRGREDDGLTVCVDRQDISGTCTEPYYDGATADYSIGLFQVNMLWHCAGDAAFDWSQYAPTYCTITNWTLVQTCVQQYMDPINNILYAAWLSQGGVTWSHWRGTATACNLL